MIRVFEFFAGIFDFLEEHYENQKTLKYITTMISIIFLLSLGIIEFNRRHLIPWSFAENIPTNHFYAVKITLDFVLIIEIRELIFGLSRSVADSVGKQFEIFSLVLLRSSFKELIHLGEPLTWPADYSPVLKIMSDGFGSLIIFILIMFYYRTQKHFPIVREHEKSRFIALKKMTALFLFTGFVFIIFSDVMNFLQGREWHISFDTLFTLLVFSDILMVIIAMRYSMVYTIVFRNTAFALATVMLRIALSAPSYINSSIGIIATIFALGISVAYNYLSPDKKSAGDASDREI